MIWPFLFDLLQVLYHSVLPVRVVLLNLFLDMLCISEGLVLPLGLMLTYAVYVLICLFYSQKFCVVQCLYQLNVHCSTAGVIMDMPRIISRQAVIPGFSSSDVDFILECLVFHSFGVYLFTYLLFL